MVSQHMNPPLRSSPFQLNPQSTIYTQTHTYTHPETTNTSPTYPNHTISANTAPDRPLRRISAQLDLSSFYIPPLYPEPGASPVSPSSSLHSQASRNSDGAQVEDGAGNAGYSGGSGEAGEGVVWLRSGASGR